MDEQIHLRDDTIYHLKQQISTQQQRIEKTVYENEDLRSQLFVKDEGIMHTTPISQDTIKSVLGRVRNLCMLVLHLSCEMVAAQHVVDTGQML